MSGSDESNNGREEGNPLKKRKQEQSECHTEFAKVIRNRAFNRANQKKWSKMRNKNVTDFQRICFILKAILENPADLDRLLKSMLKEKARADNEKSDEISKSFLGLSTEKFGANLYKLALHYSTNAVFYAATPGQKGVSLSERSSILFHLGLYKEASRDIESALKESKGLLPPEQVVRMHCQSAKILVELGKGKFEKGLELCKDHKINAPGLISDLNECIEACKTVNSEVNSNNSWYSIQPRPPEFKAVRDARPRQSSIVSSAPGLLQMKNCGVKGGWTLETARDVSVGEVLVVEKPYALSVISKRTMYCYICYKRCHNLIPCSRCARVGFCSKKCAKVGDNFSGSSAETDHFKLHYPFVHLAEASFMHAVLNCILNTDPKCLLNYCCSTEQYEQTGGEKKGHQVFVGARAARKTAPAKFDSSDYSSVAWLSAGSGSTPKRQLEPYAIDAIFLTFFLYLAGYPMEWFGEGGEETMFTGPPSSASSPPNRIPASWLAACLLYHCRSTNINNFEFGDCVYSSKNVDHRVKEHFGCCLYPTVSLLNHSCNPCAAIGFAKNSTAFVFAVRPIPAGTKITLSYGPEFSKWTKKERQHALTESYKFKCKCDACMSDFPLSKHLLNRRSRSLVCTVRLNKDAPCQFSLESVEDKRRMLDVAIRSIEVSLQEGKWTAELLPKAKKYVEDAHKFFEQPSLSITKAENVYKACMLVLHNCSTVEHWKSSTL